MNSLILPLTKYIHAMVCLEEPDCGMHPQMIEKHSLPADIQDAVHIRISPSVNSTQLNP